MLSGRRYWVALLAGFSTAICLHAAGVAQTPNPRPDLADIAVGVYDGGVVSDARGSSQSDVRITVTKTGPNTVYVTSSYPRLPAFTARLDRVLRTIQNAGGPGLFLLDLSKQPYSLDVTIDDAAWAGARSE